jgi:hypothetical protein
VTETPEQELPSEYCQNHVAVGFLGDDLLSDDEDSD